MTMYTSLLDTSVSINEEYWAVTMICNSNSSSKPATSSFGNNHALLAIEGIEKSGKVFRKYIHLMGPASIHRQSDILKNEEFHKNKAPFVGTCCAYGMQRIGQVEVKEIKHDYKYTHKSETWLRSADKVRAMLHQVEQEQNQPAEFPRPFSILGNRSIFSANLDTFKITDPLVVAIAHCDESLFLTLYDMTKKCRDNYTGIMCGPSIDKRGIQRLQDRYFYPGSIVGAFGFDAARNAVNWLWTGGVKESEASAWQSFNARWSIANVQDMPVAWCRLITKGRMYEIQKLFLQTKTSEDRQRLIDQALEEEKEFLTSVNDRIEKKLREYNRIVLSYSSRIEKLVNKVVQEYPELMGRVKNFVSDFNNDPLKAYRDLLYIIYESTDLCPLKSDSCFTWAREKLDLIDIAINDKGFESIVSPTKCYLYPIHERKWHCISCDMKTDDK